LPQLLGHQSAIISNEPLSACKLAVSLTSVSNNEDRNPLAPSKPPCLSCPVPSPPTPLAPDIVTRRLSRCLSLLFTGLLLLLSMLLCRCHKCCCAVTVTVLCCGLRCYYFHHATYRRPISTHSQNNLAVAEGVGLSPYLQITKDKELKLLRYLFGFSATKIRLLSDYLVFQALALILIFLLYFPYYI